LPLDHAQDGRMVIEAVSDGAPRRPRRDDEERDTEPPQAVLIARLLIGLRNGGGAGWHMIEEAPPFVVVDYQYGVGPGGNGHDRMVDGSQKGLAVANVGVRMVVPGGPGGVVDEFRVDVRHVGQGPGPTIGQELRDVRRDSAVLSAPECRNWD